MRPPHKKVHAACPNGVTNWSACDAATAHQWGRCKAMVEDKNTPRECSNWSVSENGWCGQHYASKVEAERRAARIAIEREAMNARADAYIEWTKTHPSIFDRMVPRKRKGPYRIT